MTEPFLHYADNNHIAAQFGGPEHFNTLLVAGGVLLGASGVLLGAGGVLIASAARPACARLAARLRGRGGTRPEPDAADGTPGGENGLPPEREAPIGTTSGR